MKSRKKTPLAAVLINTALSLLLFTFSVLLLAYIMTKRDIAPLSYKMLYAAVCALTSFAMAFLNAKKAAVKAFITLALSFVFASLFAVLPVIAVSGAQTGLSVLLLPASCLVAAFAGTLLGKKN